MKILTSDYELITALTNLFIFLLSIHYFFKTKKNKLIDNLWTTFFLVLFVSALLGVLIHGIKFSESMGVKNFCR